MKLIAHGAFPYPAVLRRGVGGDECEEDFYSGTGAFELATGDRVCRCGEGDGS